MGSSATRSVTAPTMDAATGPTEPVCVILDSMDASVTCVSPIISVSPSTDLPDTTFSPLCFIFINFSSSACPKWTFGPGCSVECQCDQQNTLECHRRHGSCVCKPGYQGPTCKEGEHTSWEASSPRHRPGRSHQQLSDRMVESGERLPVFEIYCSCCLATCRSVLFVY